MKKILTSIIFLCICGISFAENEIGIGAGLPFKMIHADGNDAHGMGYELDVLYNYRKGNGLVYSVEAVLGPYLFDSYSLKDSSRVQLNITILGGIGYDFLKDKKGQSLVLSGLLGVDILTDTKPFENYKYVDGSYVKIESSIVNFTSGINLIYSVTLKNKLSFYTGCAFIAGLGWSNDRVTRQEDRFHEEKTLYNEYKGSYEFGLLPKIGLTYKF